MSSPPSPSMHLLMFDDKFFTYQLAPFLWWNEVGRGLARVCKQTRAWQRQTETSGTFKHGLYALSWKNSNKEKKKRGKWSDISLYNDDELVYYDDEELIDYDNTNSNLGARTATNNASGHHALDTTETFNKETCTPKMFKALKIQYAIDFDLLTFLSARSLSGLQKLDVHTLNEREFKDLIYGSRLHTLRIQCFVIDYAYVDCLEGNATLPDTLQQLYVKKQTMKSIRSLFNMMMQFQWNQLHVLECSHRITDDSGMERLIELCHARCPNVTHLTASFVRADIGLPLTLNNIQVLDNPKLPSLSDVYKQCPRVQQIKHACAVSSDDMPFTFHLICLKHVWLDMDVDDTDAPDSMWLSFLNHLAYTSPHLHSLYLTHGANDTPSALLDLDEFGLSWLQGLHKMTSLQTLQLELLDSYELYTALEECPSTITSLSFALPEPFPSVAFLFHLIGTRFTALRNLSIYRGLFINRQRTFDDCFSHRRETCWPVRHFENPLLHHHLLRHVRDLNHFQHLVYVSMPYEWTQIDIKEEKYNSHVDRVLMSMEQDIVFEHDKIWNELSRRRPHMQTYRHLKKPGYDLYDHQHTRVDSNGLPGTCTMSHPSHSNWLLTSTPLCMRQIQSNMNIYSKPDLLETQLHKRDGLRGDTDDDNEKALNILMFRVHMGTNDAWKPTLPSIQYHSDHATPTTPLLSNIEEDMVSYIHVVVHPATSSYSSPVYVCYNVPCFKSIVTTQAGWSMATLNHLTTHPYVSSTAALALGIISFPFFQLLHHQTMHTYDAWDNPVSNHILFHHPSDHRQTFFVPMQVLRVHPPDNNNNKASPWPDWVMTILQHTALPAQLVSHVIRLDRD